MCSDDETTPCNDNADCAALNSVCPGGNYGNCTITERAACFPDPIAATGQANTEEAELVSVFCTPPTNKRDQRRGGHPRCRPHQGQLPAHRRLRQRQPLRFR